MYKLLAVLVASPVCLYAAPQFQAGFGDASPDEIAEIRAGTYLETFDENPVYNFNYKVADDVEQTYMAMNEDRNGDQVTGSYQYVDPNGDLIVVNYVAGPMGYTETREVRAGFVKINPRPQRPAGASFSGAANSGSSFSSSGSNSFNGGSSSSFNSGSSSFNSGASSFNSGSSGSSSSSSFNADEIVASVVSSVRPLVSNAVSSAVSSAAVPAPAPAPVALPLRPLPAPVPVIAPVVTTSNANNDIVSQVVSQISPLVSQTVSNTVGSSASAGRFAARPAPRAPAPAPAPAASGSLGSISDLFGESGNFNVRFNTPSFNIEY